jgi:hypothetical protein
MDKLAHLKPEIPTDKIIGVPEDVKKKACNHRERI